MRTLFMVVCCALCVGCGGNLDKRVEALEQKVEALREQNTKIADLHRQTADVIQQHNTLLEGIIGRLKK